MRQARTAERRHDPQERDPPAAVLLLDLRSRHGRSLIYTLVHLVSWDSGTWKVLEAGRYGNSGRQYMPCAGVNTTNTPAHPTERHALVPARWSPERARWPTPRRPRRRACARAWLATTMKSSMLDSRCMKLSCTNQDVTKRQGCRRISGPQRAPHATRKSALSIQGVLPKHQGAPCAYLQSKSADTRRLPAAPCMTRSRRRGARAFLFVICTGAHSSAADMAGQWQTLRPAQLCTHDGSSLPPFAYMVQVGACALLMLEDHPVCRHCCHAQRVQVPHL